MARPFAGVSIDIEAPAERVWAVMLDFQRYAEWNPFVIGAELAGPLRVGAALLLRVQWSDGAGVDSDETITEVTAPDGARAGRLAYRFSGWLHTLALVRAVRVQEVLALAPDRCRYSTREEFSGLLRGAVPLAKVRDGFDRHARALKARAERADGC